MWEVWSACVVPQDSMSYGLYVQVICKVMLGGKEVHVCTRCFSGAYNWDVQCSGDLALLHYSVMIIISIVIHVIA
jgi:hypothetical protein